MIRRKDPKRTAQLRVTVQGTSSSSQGRSQQHLDTMIRSFTACVVTCVLASATASPLPLLVPALPQSTTPNIVAFAAATPDLSTLVTALKAADLISTLSGPGPFTVFAPSNEAFAKLPAAYLELLLDPKNVRTNEAHHHL
jgi:uncharacterized surface protein with fasciclin (FAS1) repeats